MFKKGDIPWNKELPKEQQPFYGKTHSAAHKIHLSELQRNGGFHKGKKMPKTSIEKISKSLIGNQYSIGKHNLTKKQRKQYSDRMIGNNRNTGRHPRFYGGKRKDLKGQFFRSKWEANFARYLNWLKYHKQIKNWKYEPKSFIFYKIKYGIRSYRPDFLVTKNNGKKYWYEVKGWIDSNSKIKFKRMTKYYPNEKIILINSNSYDVIKQKLCKIIPNWE